MHAHFRKLINLHTWKFYFDRTITISVHRSEYRRRHKFFIGNMNHKYQTRYNYAMYYDPQNSEKFLTNRDFIENNM